MVFLFLMRSVYRGLERVGSWVPGGSVGRDQLAMAAKVRRHWFNPCRLGSRGHLGADFSLLLYTDLINFVVVSGAHAELSLSITLTVPAHSLLRSLPSSTSRKICITFDVDSDPSHPLKCVFGSAKQARPAPKAVSWKGGSETRNVKRSVAIVPIHLRPKFTGLKEGEAMISPIEPANTASPGVGHL